jgi:hypothetical protein
MLSREMIPVNRWIRRVILCCTAALLLPSTVEAQQNGDANGRRTVRATRMSDGETIALDGRFDEPVWQRATPADNFVQIDPNNGQAPTEPTEVRIIFDKDALYIGVTAFDSEPDKWLGYEMRRDMFLGSDDRFMWTIDTFLDARTGYFFEMNPSGLMADSLMGVNGDNRAWDGIWDARSYKHDKGWNLEIEIPFRTLNFNPENDTWGMNFQRTVRRKNEETIWTGWARNQGLRRMTNAGHVTGITNVTQGRGLEVKPYGVYTASAAPGRGQNDFDGDGSVGFDVFYNPTPVLRTNLTVNTDFAQTEVDQRQVNLTRFNLFFPEKRDFFLDGAIFFDFGSPGSGGGAGGNRGGLGADLLVNPFFSRRIGLSEAGSPQRIDTGAKITGQMGRQDVGILYVRTGDDGDFIGEDFMVGRVKRRMFTQSYVGAMYTVRNARLGEITRPGLVDGSQHTTGVDMRLATNRFLGSENLAGTVWFLNASRPGVSSGNNAFGAQIEYPNDVWEITAGLREVQDNFDPGIGFVSRNGYRRYQPSINWNPRPRGHRYIRQFGFGPEIDFQTDLNNRILTRTVALTPLEFNLHSQEQFGTELIWSHERLDVPFNISRGITLPPGAEYDFMRWRVRGGTANRRIVAVNWRYEDGDFYSGTRRQFTSTVNLRLRPGHMFYLTGEWNDVDLREGSFVSNVYRVIGETQFSPFLFVVNNFQFDTVSRVAGWQSRFRWIMKPGNDLHLVYTHNWLENPVIDRFSILDRRFASKILYTHRF